MRLIVLLVWAALLASTFVLLRIGVIRYLPELARICCFRWGAFRTTLWLVRLTRLFRVNEHTLPILAQVESIARASLGETDTVLALAQELRRIARAEGGCWHCSYFSAAAFLHSGHYQEVLAFSNTWYAHPNPSAHLHWALLQIHIAEALHRAGDLHAARARILTLMRMVRPDSGVAHVLHLRHAEMLAHDGLGEQALETLRRVDPEKLHLQHESEYFFARASALLAAHKYTEADQEVRLGLARARRAPSTRNGLFLRGQLAHAAGRLEEAHQYFQAGAAHPYKGQGGDTLLSWGDCLTSLGRPEEARQAWQLVLARDPQSAAAPQASARLGVVKSKQPHWC
ncbi:MAG TPA: hypothetical protein VLQ93_26265 [Myxococcaceae bacterium]|nr:hypothetical protein [Myxococcaceae bacterium]